jgi:hypothetical protein
MYINIMSKTKEQTMFFILPNLVFPRFWALSHKFYIYRQYTNIVYLINQLNWSMINKVNIFYKHTLILPWFILGYVLTMFMITRIDDIVKE